ncbi:hypothetical protein [Celerinatantimonas sp. MCCC 1A17872]|uniref:hypothetical protein n=1 Tax=Celerinatantimonas sp. MCCC 1A17872 TaxID=3177514 RepID=UPI0038BFDEC4
MHKTSSIDKSFFYLLTQMADLLNDNIKHNEIELEIRDLLFNSIKKGLNNISEMDKIYLCSKMLSFFNEPEKNRIKTTNRKPLNEEEIEYIKNLFI